MSTTPTSVPAPYQRNAVTITNAAMFETIFRILACMCISELRVRWAYINSRVICMCLLAIDPLTGEAMTTRHMAGRIYDNTSI